MSIRIWRSSAEDQRGQEALVASNMDLAEAEAKKFWPSDSYQKDLQQINERIVKGLPSMARPSKGPLPDALAKQLIDEMGLSRRLRSR